MTDRTPPTTDPAASPRSGFVHLHTHTEHSKQDGLSRLRDAARAAAKDGQPAVAMTDHGNVAGAWKFVKACKGAGIKPILGIEAYMALVPDGTDPDQPALEWDDPQVRFAKTSQIGMDAESGKEKRNTNNHLTILVKNETGWRNLCRIVNAAERSFYHKPLIDYALLKAHGEGLIVLSGCLGGPVASHVAAARTDHEDGTISWDEDRLDKARTNLNRLIECVGKDNVYVEIMEHGLSSEGKHHIKQLVALARECDLQYTDETGVDRLQVVATNDCHYVNECDCDAHDSWLVNGERARGNPVRKDDPNRWRFNGEGYWMRTEAEMRAIFPNATSWQNAIDETVRLAARVDEVVIPHKPLRLPKFPIPAEIVTEWQAGAELTATDLLGNEHSARKVGTRAYRTPSALYLHRLVRDGARRLYGNPMNSESKERLGFEFDVITGLGLEDYFLIVRDVIEWCRSDRGLPTREHPEGVPAQYDENGQRVPGTGKEPIMVGPGRGSAAGSAVSYCLGIVTVDPIRWGLLFERFLDIDRVGMPDIDVDFESARRPEVYEYLVARYDVIHDDGSRDHYVARIGAFQVAKTKRAIKDAARVLENVPAGEALAKLVPVHQGKPQSFAFLFEEPTDKDGLADPDGKVVPNPEAAEFRDLVARDPGAAQIVALARAFEDVVAGEGIHAAGIVISDEPLNDLLPMRLDRKNGKVVSEVPIALWDGKDIDSFGMLKLDALAIDNLDFLAAAVKHIERTHGIKVDPGALPDPDDLSNPSVSATYELLRSGGTEGVFQMESQGLTELTISAAPTQFEDISALLALYRPGPMGASMHTLFADRKTGRASVDYGIFTDDPAEAAVIESVLGDTQGVIVYQEQLMFLAGKVAGFSALERSDLRKAVSKKIATEVERLGVIFMEQGQKEMTLEDGTHKIAFQVSTLKNLWTTFQASAAYLFNKSHTVAYGDLSYVTAYFSANYPVAYAAGVLGASKKKPEKRQATIRSIHRKGIALLPPDVNRSMPDTAPDRDNQEAIRLGLTEIRDVGNNGRYIVEERERNGDFTSVRDLMSRVKVPDANGNLTAKLSVTAIEGLVEAGAFDSFGLPRLGLMIALRALSAEGEVPVPEAEWCPLERSARQRVRLGVALGDHPLRAYRDYLDEYSFDSKMDSYGNVFTLQPAPVDDIVFHGVQGSMVAVGVLTAWSERTTRKGTKMANFTIEGIEHSIDGLAFNETITQMKRSGEMAQVGDIVALSGQIKTKTITNTVINEDGEETEENREVSELIASSLRVVPVDREPQHNPVEIAPEQTAGLAQVIDLAKERASRIRADRAAAKASTRKKPAAKPARQQMTFDDLGDLSDDFGDEAPVLGMFEVSEAIPVPADLTSDSSPPSHARTEVAPESTDTGRWHAIGLRAPFLPLTDPTTGWRSTSPDPLLDSGWNRKDGRGGEELPQIIGTPEHTAIMFKHPGAASAGPDRDLLDRDLAFKLIAGCLCSCAACSGCEGHSHDPDARCNCACRQGCSSSLEHLQRPILVTTRTHPGITFDALKDVDPDSSLWRPLSGPRDTRRQPDKMAWTYVAPLDELMAETVESVATRHVAIEPDAA